MNKEQWKLIEDELKHLYNTVVLDCDGYRLRLMLVRISIYRNAIEIFVNGRYSYKWISEDCEERRRFHRPESRYLCSPKERAEQKKMGRKLLKRIGLDPDKKLICYHRYWTSVPALRRHLERHNKSITLIEKKSMEAA